MGKRHYAGHGEYVHPGEPYSPSDAELRAFPERFDPINEPSDSATTPTDAGGDGGAEGEGTNSVGELTHDDMDDLLSEYVDDPHDYNQLRSFASDVDGVSGAGISMHEIRVALVEAIRDGRV